MRKVIATKTLCFRWCNPDVNSLMVEDKEEEVEEAETDSRSIKQMLAPWSTM